MSDIGKVPNPLNPANDPNKKDKPNPLDSSQYGKKFDYRKQDETSSGRNKQPYGQEEETPKTKEPQKPTPDAIFKSSSPRKVKSTISPQKNDSSNTKEISFSAKKALEQKEINEAEENTKKKEAALSNPMPGLSPNSSSQAKKPSTEKSKEGKIPIAPPVTHQEKKISVAPSEKPKEKKKEEPLPVEPILTNMPQNPVAYQPPLLPTGSGFTSYQISQLFDRMVGIITVMDTSGITTTEFTLSGEEFASSVFYGARITITQYSTAPKAFNIQLSANPEAIALFQGNMSNLLANFEAGNYAFRINRLDTSIIEERPLFKRKGSFGSDQQPTQGDP